MTAILRLQRINCYGNPFSSQTQSNPLRGGFLFVDRDNDTIT